MHHKFLLLMYNTGLFMGNKEFAAFAGMIESEKTRVSQRDNQLLSLELNWATSQSGLTVPAAVKTLDEYCHWLSPKQTKAVKWDLLRHYATQQNSAYLPEFRANNGIICKLHNKDYSHRLITHSLPGEYWSQEKQQGFLPAQPKVCLSSGQVVFVGDVSSGMTSMTVIFDRKILEQVYTLLPYSDHEVEWEREIRAHEPISLDLALGCIPTYEFVQELNHWGQLTCVCARRIMADLEKTYLQTGKIS